MESVILESILDMLLKIGFIIAPLIISGYFFERVVFPWFYQLDVVFTKDLFFRFTHRGELFFPKIICYAKNPTRIKDISFTFKAKTEGDDSNCDCETESFGNVEKILSSSSESPRYIPSHYFPKNSGEFFLNENSNKEILVCCSVTKSKKSIRENITKLHKKRIQLFNEGQSNTNLSEEERLSFFKKGISDYIENLSNNICGNIKLSDGDYTIFCTVKYYYEWGYWFWRNKEKTIDLKISLTKEMVALYKNVDVIRSSLIDIVSYSLGNNISIRYPQIDPDYPDNKKN